MVHTVEKNRSRPKTSQRLNCGLISGLLQAGLFNPWDRALYLSVKNSRPFLNINNFDAPWSGVFQTLIQRALSAGLYFPLEDIFREMLNDTKLTSSKSHSLTTFLAGNLAGATNGLLMNPVSAVKYNYWGKTECGKENFLSSCKSMYQQGGFRPFLTGASATIQRDVVFGGIFSFMRHELLRYIQIYNSHNSHISSDMNKNSSTDSVAEGGSVSVSAQATVAVNMLSACTATIVSSPLNYIRNMHYATVPGEKPLSMRQLLLDLLEESRQAGSTAQQGRFLQQRLRIGWGTARVGCGMAVGAQIYSFCCSNM